MNIHVDDNNEVRTRIGGSDEIDVNAGDTINIGSTNYESLTNKPSIEDVELVGDVSLEDLGAAHADDIPTAVSELENDAGYITGYTETDPVFTASAAAGIESSDITAWNNKSNFSGDYDDLTNKPTLFSGNYNDLNNKPTIPTDTGDLTNGAGFITSSDIPTEVFKVEYGVTTFADAKDEYDDGKFLYMVKDQTTDQYYYPLTYYDGSTFYFDFTIEGITESFELDSVNGWSANSYSLSIPSKTSDLTNDSLFPRGNKATFYGTCATAEATKTVTCTDFTASDLTAGVTIVIAFSVANTGAVADLTLNVNSTGAHHIKYNNAGTLSNLGDKSYLKASTYMFYFDGTNWVLCGYDTNTNTIGYIIRHNGASLAMANAMYRYRIMFTSADGEKYVSANASTSTSATASKTVTTLAIDPFGEILYYSTTTAVSAGNRPAAANCTQQYNGVTLGYSFNRTGVALTLTSWKPVYVVCTPQNDGSAIIDPDTPFTQAMPTTNDGKIYIYLGIATAATTIEFMLHHPVYYHNGTGIRLWTGGA